MSKRQLDNLLRVVSAARKVSLPDLSQVRTSMDRMGDLFGVADACAVEPLTVQDAPVAEWLLPEERCEGGCLLCVHGGGFTAGSLSSHRGLYSRLAVATGAAALSVDYRLAPEHVFPAARDDVIAALNWLLSQHQGPYVAAADSAGAALLIQAIHALREEQLRLPERVLLMSPWVDMSASSESYDLVDDPLVSRGGVQRMAGYYFAAAAADVEPSNGQERAAGANGSDAWLRHPRYSPLFAQHSGFPPTLVQVGERERLLGDSRLLVERLAADGVAVVLDLWPDMVHVFQQFASRVNEGEEAVERAGAFLRSGLTDGREEL